MVNADHQFHLADYAVFGTTIVISLGIGVYYALSGGKQRTTSEYFVGNRKMAILPVAISLMVSFESSIMMLGTPAEVIDLQGQRTLLTTPTNEKTHKYGLCLNVVYLKRFDIIIQIIDLIH